MKRNSEKVSLEKMRVVSRFVEDYCISKFEKRPK